MYRIRKKQHPKFDLGSTGSSKIAKRPVASTSAAGVNQQKAAPEQVAKEVVREVIVEKVVKEKEKVYISLERNLQDEIVKIMTFYKSSVNQEVFCDDVRFDIIDHDDKVIYELKPRELKASDVISKISKGYLDSIHKHFNGYKLVFLAHKCRSNAMDEINKVNDGRAVSIFENHGIPVSFKEIKVLVSEMESSIRKKYFDKFWFYKSEISKMNNIKTAIDGQPS